MSLFNKIISFITALIISFFPSLGENPVVPEYFEDDPQYVVFMVTNVHYLDLEPYVKQMVELHGEINPDSKRMYALHNMGYNEETFTKFKDCTRCSSQRKTHGLQTDGRNSILQ